MKIAIAQQNYHIGNFEVNTQKIISDIKKAEAAGASLVVFSEMSICGYPPKDFVEFEDFIAKCESSLQLIASHTTNIAAIVGAPQRNMHKKGKPLFNAAWFLYGGKIQQSVQKSLLPNYDVFDEYRYFEPAFEWNIIEYNGLKIALTVCEDFWNLDDNPLYRISPMDQLMKFSPQLMINISASPFDYDHDEDRKEVVKANVLKYRLPALYCNSVGAQTEIIFDGGSLVYNDAGSLALEMKYFEEDFQIIETDDLYVLKNGSTAETLKPFNHEMRVSGVKNHEEIINYMTSEQNLWQIKEAIKLGIKDYFRKNGFKKAIVASSGGIDSAVTLALACEALGNENVRAVLMPSPFSTEHSVNDAIELSKNLQNQYDVIPVTAPYEAFIGSLEPLFRGLPFNITEENLQSRIRGTIVMALANKFGYILLNTSNKSELATGYGTLYGDMAGGISVIGDVYKMQVYALAEFLNKDREIIPFNIITKPPSAELRPGQKDSDSLPEYPVLDKILYQYLERRKGLREIIESVNGNKELVSRILHLVNTSEYKRNQFCPVIRISKKAFGTGRRMPVVASYQL